MLSCTPALADLVAGRVRKMRVGLNWFFFLSCLCADLVAARVRKMRVGDGLDANNNMGPLISAAGLEKVMAHVSDAVAK